MLFSLKSGLQGVHLIALMGVDRGTNNTVVRSDFGLLQTTSVNAAVLDRSQVVGERMPIGENPLLRQSIDDFKHLLDVGLKIHQNDPAALRVYRPAGLKNDPQPFGVEFRPHAAMQAFVRFCLGAVCFRIRSLGCWERLPHASRSLLESSRQRLARR
ncbi:MAG: hypothetical protein QNI88_17640 [Desulfobacterales bacterium]|nr:hypothetical protein [Desulfobacterales bacterium]